jgi:hypothetical protein
VSDEAAVSEEGLSQFLELLLTVLSLIVAEIFEDHRVRQLHVSCCYAKEGPKVALGQHFVEDIDVWLAVVDLLSNRSSVLRCRDVAHFRADLG